MELFKMNNKKDKLENESELRSFFQLDEISNKDITEDEENKKKDSIVAKALLDEL